MPVGNSIDEVALAPPGLFRTGPQSADQRVVAQNLRHFRVVGGLRLLAPVEPFEELSRRQQSYVFVRAEHQKIGRTDSIQYVEFDREAAGLVEAVLSAVADMERVDGVKVVRIADAGLVSMADIAARMAAINASLELRHHGQRLGAGGWTSLRALAGL